MIKESKSRWKQKKLPQRLAGTPRFRCALCSLLPTSEWNDQFKKTISENRIDKESRNQNGIEITLEEEMQSEISKDRRDRFSKRGQSIPSGLNIIV